MLGFKAGGRGTFAIMLSMVLAYWSLTADQGRESPSSGTGFLITTPQGNQGGFRKDVRLLAYFYPQYHRVPENDEFW
jgi:hypothetical protein